MAGIWRMCVNPSLVCNFIFGIIYIDICLNRLQLLEALIPVFGIGKGDGGFGLEPLMKFVGASLGNANADVRAAATHITVLVSLLPSRYLCADWSKYNNKMAENVASAAQACTVSKRNIPWPPPWSLLHNIIYNHTV